MTQTTSRRPALRPEARAVERARLDPRQQAAFDKIMKLLDEAAIAVDGLEPPTAKPARPYLDAERSSRTVLIHGRRGTGKTTLLLSLLKALAEPTDALPVGRKVVLLDTLDMEPLAESTNLIGAVLARLEAVAGSPGETAERPGGWSRVGRVPGEETVMMKLVDLQTRAASAFGSNLRDRAGGLDPDNFAVEVRRAERHRMDFGQQFAHVVAEVAQHLKKTRPDLGQAPLFVLPVDDLDLNPTACAPLLEGLRAVHSPHLFVLMLADLELIRAVLRLQYQARFVYAGDSTMLDAETHGHIADLAVNALRKHLPPSQRLRLTRVAPEQAASFPFLGDERPTNVYKIFRDVRLSADRVWVPGRSDLVADAPPRTIHQAKDWLPDPTATTASGTAADPLSPATAPARGSVNSWAEVFRMSFRELVDVVLDAEADGEPDDDGDVVPDARAQRRHMARLTEERLEGIVRAAGLGVEAHSELSVRARVSWSTVLLEPEGYRLRTADLKGWSVEWRDSGLNRDEQQELAGILDIEGADLPFQAYVERSCPALRETLPPGDDGPELPWPMPQHATCWGYEDAARLLATADDAWAELPDRWFGAWVDAMTQVIEQALDVAVPASPGTGWSLVGERLRQLGKEPLGRNWRVEVLALCTPEMGMVDPSPLRVVKLSGKERAEVQRLREARVGNRSQRFKALVERQLWS
jgi:hypothetical protein